MSILVMNMSGAATLAAAEGLAAIGVGDTALARQKYGEAGAILERDMKAHDGGSEKQLLRFLAATQYYKGGDYQKAQELATKIDARALPKNIRGLLPQFLKDVKFRAAPGYAAGIRQTLYSLRIAQKPREALTILQDHPYVAEPAVVAFMRATLCDQIPDYRAAALFFASAIRFAGGDIRIAFMSVVTPLVLLRQGRISEAREYVRQQLELFPNSITYVTGSIVNYHQFVAASLDERQQHSTEQFKFVEQAWDAYQNLSTEQRSNQDMRAYMAFGFGTAAATWLKLGNKTRGKEAWEQAVQLDPELARSWVSSAFATSANGQGPPATEDEYLSERETHFSTRFAPEAAIRQQLEMVGA
jgi:tetratricopeptide (TPR) repeat protein